MVEWWETFLNGGPVIWSEFLELLVWSLIVLCRLTGGLGNVVTSLLLDLKWRGEMVNAIKMMDEKVIEWKKIQVSKARFGPENRRLIRKGEGGSAPERSHGEQSWFRLG